jgi:hypothetical protein
MELDAVNERDSNEADPRGLVDDGRQGKTGRNLGDTLPGWLTSK